MAPSSYLDTMRDIVKEFSSSYSSTPPKMKILDGFAATALLTAVLQFIYASLVGNFPFNAFLSAFFCCIGTFVLTLGLRMKLSEGGGGSSSGSQVGEFGGYALAMCTLLLASWNYIG